MKTLRNYVLNLLYKISGVHLTLKNKYIPINGTVLIDEIGFTDDTALLCHTNYLPSPNSVTSGGDWFGPNGTRVLGEHEHNGVPGFVRNRDLNVVRLKRSNSMIQPEGVYKCVIQDDTLANQTLYVRLYGMYIYNDNEKSCVNTLIMLQSLHHPYPLPSMETKLFQLTPYPVELISSPSILPSPREIASTA